MKKKKAPSRINTQTNAKRKNIGFVKTREFMGSYFTMYRPYWIVASLFFLLGMLIDGKVASLVFFPRKAEIVSIKQQRYWFFLERAQNIEYLYYGLPEDTENSKLIKTFIVKTGIPYERPTPLPQLTGKEYWLITKKYPSDNPETAPYFLELNVPGVDKEPFGPFPYQECNGPASNQRGKQCNWILPGSFGLHGVNGDSTRLSSENPGSSGCIRHSDSDITLLYELLRPEKEEIRYYVRDI